MDAAKRWLNKSAGAPATPDYQVIPEADAEPDTVFAEDQYLEQPDYESPRETVSVFEYGIFLLQGVAMLWSWNMFMACATYFQRRFAENDYILKNFQSMILGVSTVTNLSSVLYLSNRQNNANYPYRICVSLVMNCLIFTLLALSTLVSSVGAELYLAFTLLCVFVASLSTGFSQNGVFAFMNRFGGAYTQAVMTGQGIAGVLPAIAQIVSVLAIPQKSNDRSGTASPKAALAYFFTATFVSGICFCLFLAFLARHGIGLTMPAKPLFEGHYDSEEEEEGTREKKAVSLFVLLSKLKYLSFAIWLNYCVTMVFPVFTEAVVSVHTGNAGRMFQPDVFIPAAFFLWNLGDLLGRIVCGWSQFTTKNPTVLVVLSMARILFIPLYFMCNIRGHGAVIESDLFYWLVQLVFGFTNGWIGSNCMMAAPSFVNEDEVEPSGGFMGFCLVVGLACGSVLSFFLNL